MLPKVYTVYCTVNTVTDRFYIGVHRTVDPGDSYLGSGVWLLRSVAKYGRHSFIKNIIFTTHDKDEAFNVEAYCIDKVIGNPMCMNLRDGGPGPGGFDFVIEKERTDPVFKERMRLQRAANIAKVRNTNANGTFAEKQRRAATLAALAWRGQHHTPAYRAFKSLDVSNRRWVYSAAGAKHVKMSELESFLTAGWKLGKKPPIIKIRKKRELKVYDHGTAQRREKTKCDCIPCVQAYRLYWREYKRLHPSYKKVSKGP